MMETRSDLERERADLSRKLGSVVAEITAIKAEMSVKMGSIEAESQRIRSRLGQIDTELRRREANDAMVPTISDHALLRYIERVYGVDVEAMKAELMTDNVVLAIKSGATAVKSKAGTMVIKGSTVVTFLEPEMRPKRRTQRGMKPLDGDFEYDPDA